MECYQRSSIYKWDRLNGVNQMSGSVTILKTLTLLKDRGEDNGHLTELLGHATDDEMD